MRDGLYKVTFATAIGSGIGVVHLRGGNVHGGDAGLYYKGFYKASGDELSATIQTGRYTSDKGGRSVLGVDRATLRLRGQREGDSTLVYGTAAEAPGVIIEARLERISD